MQKVTLSYNKGEINVDVPDSWSVKTVKKTAPPLTREKIRECVLNPVGSLRLRDIAIKLDTNNARVALIFEDHTRFTPLADAMEIVLEELNAAGIKDEQIFLIGASATHRAATRKDIESKLGGAVSNRLKIIEHHCRNEASLKYVGDTSFGNKIFLNKEVAESDLIVGVGGIAPHGSVQFGGGAKLLLPGVAGFETIKYNHTSIDQSLSFQGNEIRPMRRDMEEALKLVPYRFNVSGLIDHGLNLVDMVAGDPIEAHRAGMKKATALYHTTVEKCADVVFACSHPFDVDCFQSVKGILPALPFAKRRGVIIWLSACPEGIGTHQLTQIEDSYRLNMNRMLSEICEKTRVFFAAPSLKYEEVRPFLAPEIVFFDSADKAVGEAVRNSPQNADAVVLYASPLTVGVQEQGRR